MELALWVMVVLFQLIGWCIEDKLTRIAKALEARNIIEASKPEADPR